MSLAPGARLGAYEILSLIGAGGMGEVYRARDTRLGREVAIKVLPAQFSADPDLRVRFEREARAISSLEHAHICALYDVGEHDGTMFLVMQLLEGETLEARLRKGALPIAEALEHAIEIAEALTKAHRHGVIHRDLKPGNIMLARSGAVRHGSPQAMLLDFGLAKTRTDPVAGELSMLPTTPPNLTAQGTLVGTFQYMAPEQLEGEDADARTDIFAFGAVLYEMLTGKRAFEGKSQASLIAAILERDPPPVSTLQPMVSKALDRVVRRCLEKDPELRWQTTIDLLDELKWASNTSGSVAGAGTPVAAKTASRRVAWMAAGSSVLLAGALAAVAWTFAREVPAEGPFYQSSLLMPRGVSMANLGAPAQWLGMSPDGKWLAFVGFGENGRQLVWLRSLDGRLTYPLAGTDDGTAPFWSPDSRFVGFFAAGVLKKIAVAGGPPVPLCAYSGTPVGGTWNGEDVILFAASSQGRGIYRVAAAGGTPVEVLTPDPAKEESQYWWPGFLSDGDHFIYLAVGGAAGSPMRRGMGIYVASLSSQDRRQLAPGGSNAKYAQGHLFYLREGALVAQPLNGRTFELVGEAVSVAEGVQVGGPLGTNGAFTVSAAGSLVYMTGSQRPQSQLAWFDRTGRKLEGVGPSGILLNPRLSPDGTRVAVAKEESADFDIWLMELSRGQILSRFTFIPGGQRDPVWSPDGMRLVFTSAENIFAKTSNAAGREEPFLPAPNITQVEDWSPDGKALVYTTGGVAPGLWRRPLEADSKPAKLFDAIGASVMHARISPDGRWIAYVSDESGRPEVYVQGFPEQTGKWTISSGGGIQPKWRRDGRELYYLAADKRLMAVDIVAGATLQAGTPRALFLTSLSGTPVPLVRHEYDVSADGQRFLMNVPIEPDVPPVMTLIVNWQAKTRD
jgi:Tol biopolymer transport system component